MKSMYVVDEFQKVRHASNHLGEFESIEGVESYLNNFRNYPVRYKNEPPYPHVMVRKETVTDDLVREWFVFCYYAEWSI